MSNPTYRGNIVLDRILPAVQSSVGSVRRELDLALHRLDAPKELRGDVAIVVSEAVTNVVLHAYVGMPRGPLYAAARVTSEALEIVVGDAGRGLAPRVDSPGLGFGLSLMRRLCDDLVVAPRPQGTGTIVTAAFRRTLPPPSAGVDRARRDSLHEYVRALLASSADKIDDANALVAEADQALRRGAQIRRAYLRAPTSSPARPRPRA